MVHEERRIRNALQTQHEMKEWSFETEEYTLYLTSVVAMACSHSPAHEI